MHFFVTIPAHGAKRGSQSQTIGLADPPHVKPRGPHRIKFNLMVSADCEPTSVLRASAMNRHLDRVEQRIRETIRCMLKEKCPY
jgi:hypothetical protein